MAGLKYTQALCRLHLLLSIISLAPPLPRLRRAATSALDHFGAFQASKRWTTPVQHRPGVWSGDRSLPVGSRHGSITFMSITIKLQLHLILPITIKITKLPTTILQLQLFLVACKNGYIIRSTIFLRYCPPALVHYSSVSSVKVNFTNCCT